MGKIIKKYIPELYTYKDEGVSDFLNLNEIIYVNIISISNVPSMKSCLDTLIS